MFHVTVPAAREDERPAVPRNPELSPRLLLVEDSPGDVVVVRESAA